MFFNSYSLGSLGLYLRRKVLPTFYKINISLNFEISNDIGTLIKSSAKSQERAQTISERKQILKFSLSSTPESSKRCSKCKGGKRGLARSKYGSFKDRRVVFRIQGWHPSKEEGKLDDCSVQLKWRLALGDESSSA